MAKKFSLARDPHGARQGMSATGEGRVNKKSPTDENRSLQLLKTMADQGNRTLATRGT